MQQKFITFPIHQVITLFVVTLIGILLSVGFSQPLLFGFLPGFLFLCRMITSKGVSLSEVTSMSWSGIKKTRGVIYILLLVSLLLPSWYLGGTIDQLVSVALQIITVEHYFLMSFIVSVIFSMILGTSVGTLSAIGIPIMSGAVAIGLPAEIVAGSVISGAFVGDRTSPFSSAFQLVCHTIETKVNHQFKAFLPSTLLAIVIGILFFGFFDSIYSKQIVWNEALNTVGTQASILNFLPPIILIAFVITRIKIIYAFLWSIIAASWIAIYKGVGFDDLFHALWFGTEGVGGGFTNMYLLLLFLALAGAYNGLLETYHVIQPLLDRWLVSSSNIVIDTFKVMLATLGITLIAANQTLPIILTGRSFLPHWKSKYGSGELGRVMGDSTMLFPGMVPWSVLAIMCSTVVGVPLFSYLPYAVLLWSLPILSLIISLILHRRKKYHHILQESN